MRILHLTTASRIGGAERLLIQMAAHGPARGHEYLFCTLQAPGALHGAIRSSGGTALSLGLNGTADLTAAVPRLLELVVKHRVDLLHTHLFHAGVLAWAASRLSHLPPRVHTRHYGRYLHLYGSRWQVLLDQWSTRAAEHVVAISGDVRTVLVDLEGVPADRVSVIWNGIKPQEPGPAYPAGPAAAHPIAIGSLERWKGHQHLIEAMPLVRQRVPSVRLTICGEGPERPALGRLIRSLGLEETIQLPGYREDATQLLGAADLLVHPSLEEGFGVAVLEAMSQALAVVATRVGGIPEVVEDGVTGLLVPPANGQLLAQAITDLLADPERRRLMGIAGRLRLERHFTIGAMLERYSVLYNRMLASHHAGERKAA